MSCIPGHAHLHDLLGSDGPDHSLHGAHVSTADVGELGQQVLVQLHLGAGVRGHKAYVLFFRLVNYLYMCTMSCTCTLLYMCTCIIHIPSDSLNQCMLSSTGCQEEGGHHLE